MGNEMGLDNWIPILVIVGMIYMFFFRGRSKKSYEKEISLIGNEVMELKKEIMCVTSSNIHGKEIVQTLGSVKGTSKTIITNGMETKIADNEAMYEMLIEAKILGANAIVDIKMNTPTFEVSGSKWQTSQIIYTGTAVKVE